MKKVMDDVKHVILILSGKGGVGKSTISCQLALTLMEVHKFKVGLLDIDLCGPSVPYLLQLEGKEVQQSRKGWVPVYFDEDKNLAVMSIGFLLKNRDDAVIWRGPKKTSMIREFFEIIDWQEIDYLIIDTPPGTSDEHISVMDNLQNVKFDGAILVTTSQLLSTEDVQKEISFCRKLNIPIIGVIENMSGYTCPNCKHCTNIFSAGGGKALAELNNVPFLGALNIDPEMGALVGKSCVKHYPDSKASEIFKSIANHIVNLNNE